MGSQSRVSGMPELPCAACRLLHRKCNPDCILAPHFPTDQPNKFVIMHKVFGASNVVKMLQALVEATTEDAVKSIIHQCEAPGPSLWLQKHCHLLAKLHPATPITADNNSRPSNQVAGTELPSTLSSHGNVLHRSNNYE